MKVASSTTQAKPGENGAKLRRRFSKAFRQFKQFPATPFAVRQCISTVEFLAGAPRVLLTRRAYDTMFHIVDLADKEIGWLGTVTRRGSDFVIDEIFLFKQKVSDVETEISAEGIAEVGQEILMTRPDGMEVCNSLQFWGHSHVRMDTRPSGPDEMQMEMFRDSGHPWFIRGIFNKNGKAQFAIFFYDIGVKIEDVTWSIIEDVDDSMRASLQAEIAAKVTDAPPPVQVAKAHYGLGEDDELDAHARAEGFKLLGEIELHLDGRQPEEGEPRD